jgi:hypothetical protein
MDRDHFFALKANSADDHSKLLQNKQRMRIVYPDVQGRKTLFYLIFLAMA